jgi:hypothetical protein
MLYAYNGMAKKDYVSVGPPSPNGFSRFLKQPWLLLLLVRQSPFSQLITTGRSLFPDSLDLFVIRS